MTSNTRRNVRRAAAAHPQRPERDQSALLVAATRRGPASVCTPQDAAHQEAIAMGVPVPRRAVASHLTDDRLADRAIGFADIPAEDPDLLTADPQPADAVRGVEPSPLRAGHEHADTVLAEMRAETAALLPRGEHVTHHQLPHGAQLRVVPLVDPVDALCDGVELAIARFACAVSDLAVRPDGAYLVANLLMTSAAERLFGHDVHSIDWDALKPRAVTAYDHRPIGVTVGHELAEVAA